MHQRSGSRKTEASQVKRRCHRCQGTGREPCQICGGAGQIAKGKDVFGNTQYGRCDGCFGNKSRRCTACSGEGFI